MLTNPGWTQLHLNLAFLTGIAHPARAGFLHNSPALTGQSNQIKSTWKSPGFDHHHHPKPPHQHTPPRWATSGDAHPTSTKKTPIPQPSNNNPPLHLPKKLVFPSRGGAGTPGPWLGCSLRRAAVLCAAVLCGARGPGGAPGCQRCLPAHCTGTPGGHRRPLRPPGLLPCPAYERPRRKQPRNRGSS